MADGHSKVKGKHRKRLQQPKGIPVKAGSSCHGVSERNQQDTGRWEAEKGHRTKTERIGQTQPGFYQLTKTPPSFLVCWRVQDLGHVSVGSTGDPAAQRGKIFPGSKA